MMNGSYADEKVMAVSKEDRGIRLGDQLEETERLIGFLSEKIKGLEEKLGGILRHVPLEAEGGERGQDVDPSLAPIQHQVMAHYMQLNKLCGQVDDMTRRVQL